MEYENRIDVTDRDGWRKEFVLNKRLIYIGSDSRNDIVLSPMRGSGVAPRHLQLVIAPAGVVACSAVNLSTVEIALGEGGQKILLPNSALEVGDGECFRLGDFSVVFHSQDTGMRGMIPVMRDSVVRGGAKSSSNIGLRISLPQVVLGFDSVLDGTVFVANLGTSPGVQFKLGLDGLPPDCYEIGPAPILFPGAEKGVPLRIRHPRRSAVPAGTQRVTVWASAEETYPAEIVAHTLDLRIMSFFSHTLRVLPVE